METSVSSKRHYILVHGACHGAWCWYKVVALLESAGHSVTSIDLAISEVHSQSPGQVSSVHDYVRPLMDAIAAVPAEEKVILVGHSMGGMALSLAIEAFPEKILAAVYATAFMPGPRLPPSDLFAEITLKITVDTIMDSIYSFDNGPTNPPTSMIFGPQCLSSKLYNSCSSQDLKLAMMLVKPTRLFTEDLMRDYMFTEAKFSSVAQVYIVCKDDLLLDEDLQRWMVDKARVSEVMEIKESDHMVMLSKPRELYECLLLVAEKYI